MRTAFRFVASLFLALTALAGCGLGAPSEADARRVLVGDGVDGAGRTYELTSFEKVNGQRSEFGGVRFYEMEYRAEFECGPSKGRSFGLDLMFTFCAGQREGVPFEKSGSLRFEETERGWRGPDGEVY